MSSSLDLFSIEVNFTICKSRTESQFVIHKLWAFNGNGAREHIQW